VAGSYTETTNDPTQLNTIGQRLELSFYDAKIVNIEYCNGRFTCQIANKVFVFFDKMAFQFFKTMYIPNKTQICHFIAAVCPTKLACKNGGYTDPKNCAVCRCPDGLGGTLCDRITTGSAGKQSMDAPCRR
jgi:hypothetical protein